MTRAEFLQRGWLYFAIGSLTGGLPFLPAPYNHVATALLGGLVALRAYIDKTAAQVYAPPTSAESGNAANQQ